MKALKIVSYIVGVAILISLLLVVGIAYVLTTGWGQTKILDLVNQNIPGKVLAKDIHLSLFGDQKIEGLELVGNDGEVIVKVDRIDVASPLFKLVATQNLGGTAEIKGLEAKLQLSSKGTFNVNDALGLPSPEIKSAALLTPVILKNVNANIKFENLFSKMDISASGTTQQGSEQGFFELTGQGEPNFSPSLQLKGSHFPVAILDQIIAIKNPKIAGMARLALGDSADFIVTLNGDSNSSNFEGKITTSNLLTAFKGTLNSDLLTLQTPTDVNFRLTPELYTKLSQLYLLGKAPAISQIVPVKLTISTLNLKLNDFEPDLNKSDVIATASIGQTAINLDDAKGRIDIESLNAQFNSVSNNPNVSIKIHTQGKQNGNPLMANIEATIEKPKEGFISVEQAINALELQAKLAGFPYLGKIWDVQIDSKIKNKEATAIIKLSTEGLQLPEIIAFASETTAPSLRLKLSPDQFAALHKQWLSNEELPFRLAKPAVATIELPGFNFNLKTPKQGGELVAKLDFKDVALVDAIESKKITFGDIKGEFKTVHNSLHWNFVINGLGDGLLNLSGILPSPFSSDSTYSLKDLSFEVHVDSQGVPVVIATRLAGFDPKISRAVEAMLGPRVEVKADISLNKLNGPVQSTITGDNGSIVLDGRASNGVLLLNRPIVAQSQVTPQFGKDVFGLVLPILNSALSADSPCQLTISDKGFTFPFSPYDFKLIKIDNATLSLGKISFSSQGELASLLNLFSVKKSGSISCLVYSNLFFVESGSFEG